MKSCNWNGAKSQICKWILGFFPYYRDYSIYVEPFGGSATILLNKYPSKVEIYNDLNKDIVNFFRILRDNGEELQRLLHLTPYAKDELSLSLKTHNVTDIERARRFAIKCQMDYRINKNSFRTCRVGQRTDNLAKSFIRYTEDLTDVIIRLKDVSIENRNGLDLIRLYNNYDNVFIYIDPPYVDKNHYEVDFDEKHHIELLELIKKSKAKILLSGYDNDLYNTHLKGWGTETKVTNVGCFSKGVKRTEKIWKNYLVQKGLFDENNL